jgi:hypothetical protein
MLALEQHGWRQPNLHHCGCAASPLITFINETRKLESPPRLVQVAVQVANRHQARHGGQHGGWWGWLGRWAWRARHNGALCLQHIYHGVHK